MVRAVRGLREKMFALERLENGTCVFGPEAEQPSHLRHADGEPRHVEELVSDAERILIDWITWGDHRHTSRNAGFTGNLSRTRQMWTETILDPVRKMSSAKMCGAS